MKKVRKVDQGPERVFLDFWEARRALVLAAAVELDLFTKVAEGARTAQAIARAIGGTARGTSALCDALVAAGYLEKRRSGRYTLAPLAARYLVATSPAFLGAVVEETRLTLPAWMKLGEVVRSGLPLVAVDREKEGREFFPRLVRSIFPLSYGAARAAVASLTKKQRKRVRRILDVAAGAAPWSIAFAEALPEARVTVVDYPEVVAIARETAQRHGVADRFEYLEGNLRDVDFGRDGYDLVILGQILHSEGETWGRRLVKRSAQALRERGLLLIAEMVPNDDRTGPPMPVFFGLNMLLHTQDGGVFTYREYRKWLKEAGFGKVKRIEAPAPSPLILATL